MKEYICKDELLKRKWDINHANTPFNFIDICPTVTKADICREFFEELRDRMYHRRDTSYQGMCDFGYELLKEMEDEE